MTSGMAYISSTLSIVFRVPGWRKACSFASTGAGSGELRLLQPPLPRSRFASARSHSRLRRRPIIPATPRRRRRSILDILLPDILIRRRQAQRRAMLAMVILVPTPTMGILAPTPVMVIPAPTPIIHTLTGVGPVGVGRAGAGVGPGSRLAGAGAAGGAAEDVGTAGSAAASEEDLLMLVSMAEALAVAFMAAAGTISSRG